MTKFNVRVFEVYSSYYEVEADSEESAKELAKKEIESGSATESIWVRLMDSNSWDVEKIED